MRYVIVVVLIAVLGTELVTVWSRERKAVDAEMAEKQRIIDESTEAANDMWADYAAE